MAKAEQARLETERILREQQVGPTSQAQSLIMQLRWLLLEFTLVFALHAASCPRALLPSCVATLNGAAGGGREAQGGDGQAR